MSMSFIALLAFGIGAGIMIAFVIAFTSDVVGILTRPLDMRRFKPPVVPGDEPPVDTGYWREKYMREHPEVFGNWK